MMKLKYKTNVTVAKGRQFFISKPKHITTVI